MAETQGPRQTLTLKANGDLSAKQWHIMRLSAAGVVDQASNAAAGFNVGAIGVLENKPAAANRSATLVVGGVSKVVAGGAINTNVLLTTNGSGRAAAATSGQLVIGRALEAAAADGDVISYLAMPVVRLSGAV